MSEFRFEVWSVPQIPCKAFRHEVPTLDEAIRLETALALYDQHQLAHNVKPDYASVSGIRVFADFGAYPAEYEEDGWVELDEWAEWMVDQGRIDEFSDEAKARLTEEGVMLP